MSLTIAATGGSSGAPASVLAGGGTLSGFGGSSEGLGGAAASGGMLSTLGGSTAGNNGVGGVLQAGGMGPTGGNAAGGIQSAGGTTSVAGGASGSECVTNADCFATHADQPYVCVNGACASVTSANCPVLIPGKTAMGLLRSSSPILVGGFANMSDAAAPHQTKASLNWDLAFDEFNVRTQGGLPSYESGGLRRPFVGVLCQGYANSVVPQDIVASMAHLTAIGVTSVLSIMAATDLYTAWSTTAASQSTFFMNAGSANLALVKAPSNGLLWHVLGDPHTLAGPIAALVRQMEPYINQQRVARFKATGLDNPDTEPLRVTMVYSTHPSMLDTHDVLTATDNKYPDAQLTFNGKSYVDNGANYREVKVDSASLVSNVNVSAAVSDIEDHLPHVVLGVGTEEITSVIGSVEAHLAPSDAMALRPYYVLSSLLFNSPTLPGAALRYSSETPPLNLRVAGANYGSALDSRSKSIYNAYLNRLLLANPNTTLILTDTENYYDAAYYLLYSIAAAAGGRAVPTAMEIKTGFLEHVINTTSGVTIDMGPESIATTVANLLGNTQYAMALWTNGGYPRFDTQLGTRANLSSAWCIAKDDTNSWAYQPDGLVYDELAHSFEPSPKGIPSCLQSYCPAGTGSDAGVTACPQEY